MRSHSCFAVCTLALFIGCNQSSEPVPKDNDGIQEQQNAPEEFTHTISLETEYYTTGPQQGRPPDGSFQIGMKIKIVEDAGSYSMVESEDGVRAYVATESLKDSRK